MARRSKMMLFGAIIAVIAFGVTGCILDEDLDENNVSLRRSFRDHQLVFPRDAEGMRYYSNSDVDNYPLYAALRVPCRNVGEFIEENKLMPISPNVAEFNTLSLTARDDGWDGKEDPRDKWLYRNSTRDRYAAAVLVDDTQGKCALFIEV